MSCDAPDPEPATLRSRLLWRAGWGRDSPLGLAETPASCSASGCGMSGCDES